MDVKAFDEKPNLGAVAPTAHVSVEVLQVGIVIIRLEERSHAELLTEPLGQAGLASAHVARDGDHPWSVSHRSTPHGSLPSHSGTVIIRLPRS